MYIPGLIPRNWRRQFRLLFNPYHAKCFMCYIPQALSCHPAAFQIISLIAKINCSVKIMDRVRTFFPYILQLNLVNTKFMGPSAVAQLVER